MRPQLVLVIILATCNVSLAQSVVRWINLDNQFVIEPLGDRAVSLGGIDIQSDAGLLVPGESAEPFLCLPGMFFQLEGVSPLSN